ncbi:MAG: AAA family ATPase [Bdellovibrionales bacterium RIFOXYD1_FULL_53_11]|nr:MAG: AAA family ATPase [Bdellovibrionales bacterium RIFOXYD1_FULL_53_11]
MNSELVIYDRTLDLFLPKRQSAFLWGARKTGKSTYLKARFGRSVRYDLLESDLYYRLLKEPHLFRQEMAALKDSEKDKPVIVDEVQRIPALLDEIHLLIENAGMQFILCGSSARKLRRSHANLLGGRAWRFEMHPLASHEIPGFDILRALNNGLIPSHYQSEDRDRSLRSYVMDYLDGEIKAESLARSVPAFSRFLDSLGFSNGELTNYSRIASDCGVDSKTVKEYYQILVDTLLGCNLFPFFRKKGRETIKSTPKFYLFDVGLAGFLQGRQLNMLKGAEAGKAFEHFILMEIIAWRSYKNHDFEICFWRTKTGLEVDFILSRANRLFAAIEVKITDRIRSDDLKGMNAFLEEHKVERAVVVCNEKRRRRVPAPGNQHVDILPWQAFVEDMYGWS